MRSNTKACPRVGEGKLGQSYVVRWGEDARELPCIRVDKLEQLLKSGSGFLRVGEVVSSQIFIRLCILFHNMRGRRFTKVCGKATISLYIEDVLPYGGYRGGEVSGLCRSCGGAIAFRIGPHGLARMLPC